MSRAGIQNIDESRYAIERMDPADYLSSSYYERWLDARLRILIEKGGDRRAGARRAHKLLYRAAGRAGHGDREHIALVLGRGAGRSPSAFRCEPAVAPRFAPGDQVVTRHAAEGPHATAALRSGKRGVIELVHGTYVFPDTNALGQGEQPQPLYSVRFDAADLWGDTAEPNQSVNIDLWESYLLPG